ncbi:MAG: ribonuclease HI family protein [Actinomycetota bacterium]|nr:ribonuclease HI family protein [Actinomycetota bacterium]
MIKKLIIYSDGAARGNPGPAGAGGQIKTPGGKVLSEVSEYLGETTNNVAEYKALILTLQEAMQFEPAGIIIRSDSELLVKQLTGEYKVKNRDLKPLHELVKQLLEGVGYVDVEHVPRNKNRRADELANEAIDRFIKGKKAEVEIEKLPKQGSLF